MIDPLRRIGSRVLGALHRLRRGALEKLHKAVAAAMGEAEASTASIALPAAAAEGSLTRRFGLGMVISSGTIFSWLMSTG